MKKSILLLTITMMMSACGNKAAQAASDANKTDSALADKESIAVADAPSEDEQAFNKFFDQLSFDDFVALLKTPNDNTAKKCGLSPIYSANSEPSEEGDADTSNHWISVMKSSVHLPTAAISTINRTHRHRQPSVLRTRLMPTDSSRKHWLTVWLM